MEEPVTIPTIPGRPTILAASWIFIAASIILLTEFYCIHAKPPAALTTITPLGWLEGIGWLVGFALLIDWLVFSIFPVAGGNRRALMGATLKLIASCFFCVQPISALTGPTYVQGMGAPWSNFVGILFFHSGNVLDSFGMLCEGMFDFSKPLSWANMPVWGMWTYQCATWFLVIADSLDFFSIPQPNGPGLICQPPSSPPFPPPLPPHPSPPPPALPLPVPSSCGDVAFVGAGQKTGAFLLLVGSLIYTAWGHMATPLQKTTEVPLAAPLTAQADYASP